VSDVFIADGAAVIQLIGLAELFKALTPTEPEPQLKHETHLFVVTDEHPIQ
jgi:hypothetical protein